MKNILIFGATGNVGSYLTLYAKNFLIRMNITLLRLVEKTQTFLKNMILITIL